MSRLKIIYVTRLFPFPPNRGEKQRDYHLLASLAGDHDVTLVSRVLDRVEPEAVAAAGEMCRRVQTVDIPSSSGPAEALRRQLRPMLRGLPLSVGTMCSPRIGRLIRTEVTREAYDAVVLAHTPLAHYLDDLPRSFAGARFLDLHNVESVRYPRLRALEPSPARRLMLALEGARLGRFERRVVRRFDQVFTVSEEERRQVLAWTPAGRVTTVENGVDTAAGADFETRVTDPDATALLFVGSMNYLANQDGICWFVEAVLPLIRRRVPAVQLAVVGHGPPARVRRLAGEGVVVTGSVDSVEPHYASAALVVIPLRAGGGSRLKILEAMNYGIPVVSTTLGAEGLRVTPGADIAIADDPAEMASEVIRLLNDGAARKRLAENGRRLVIRDYDWAVQGKRFKTKIESCVEERRGGSPVAGYST